MGKGDIRSKKGKISAGTNGNTRKRKPVKPVVEAKPKAKKAAAKKTTAKKATTTAAKKTTAKKTTAKKTAAKKED